MLAWCWLGQSKHAVTLHTECKKKKRKKKTEDIPLVTVRRRKARTETTTTQRFGRTPPSTHAHPCAPLRLNLNPCTLLCTVMFALHAPSPSLVLKSTSWIIHHFSLLYMLKMPDLRREERRGEERTATKTNTHTHIHTAKWSVFACLFVVVFFPPINSTKPGAESLIIRGWSKHAFHSFHPHDERMVGNDGKIGNSIRQPCSQLEGVPFTHQ